MSSRMLLSSWGLAVDGLGIACSKAARLSTAGFSAHTDGWKTGGLRTFCTNLLPRQFHSQKTVFISVIDEFIPTFHTTNKNNNKINKLFSSSYTGGAT